MRIDRKIIFGGVGAGTVAGIFGTGGGLILIPLLSKSESITEENIFPTSICIILPICITTLVTFRHQITLAFPDVVPYLLGSIIGGIAASILRKKVPTLLLHRVLGWMIIWGGFRYLCA